MRQFTICLLLSVVVSFACQGQTKEAMALKVGDQMPNYKFDDVRYYSKKSFSLSDFRGTPIILDFWAVSCSSCIKAFPHIKQMQEKYKDRLKIISVGYLGRKGEVKMVYERLRKQLGLDLTVAFDSLNFDRIVPGAVPYLVWLSPNGKVAAITLGSSLNEENIEKFITGQAFEFRDVSYQTELSTSKKFDPKKPFLISGNGGAADTTFLFRSVLSEWKPGMGMQVPGGIRNIQQGNSFQVLRVSLPLLFCYGNFEGLFYPSDFYQKPIYEIPDTSRFREDKAKQLGYYCYSVHFPLKTSGAKIRKTLLNDIEITFGYYSVIEERNMPCYVLRVVDKEKTKELFKSLAPNKLTWKRGIGGMIVDQTPLNALSLLTGHIYGIKSKLYDETGIVSKVNMKINALTTDLGEMRKSIAKYGLDITKEYRPAKVLVIRER